MSTRLFSILATTLVLVGFGAWLAFGPSAAEPEITTADTEDTPALSPEQADTLPELERGDLDTASQPDSGSRRVPAGEDSPTPTQATMSLSVMEEGTGVPLTGWEVVFTFYEAVSEKRLAFGRGRVNTSGVWSTPMPVGEIRYQWELHDLGPWQVSGGQGEIRVVPGATVAIKITLPQLFHLNLRILDAYGGPVAHQEVRIYAYKETFGGDRRIRRLESVRTDGDGRVVIPFLEGGLNLQLDPVPEGLLPMQWVEQVGAVDHRRQLIFQLVGSREMSVKVQDSDGGPVAGAEVRGLDYSSGTPARGEVVIGPKMPAPAVTDQRGKVVMVVPEGREFALRVRHVDFLSANLELLADQTEVVVTLQRGRGLRGRVINRKGEGVSGAEVRAWVASGFDFSPNNRNDWKEVKTDDRGYFEITSLDGDGSTWLLVIAEGYAYFSRSWPSTPDEYLELVMELQVPLFGKLVNLEGEGIHQALIEMRGEPAFGQKEASWMTLSYYAETYRVRTTESGSFSFPGIAPGPYELQAKGDFPATSVQVFAGPDPVLITAGELTAGLLAPTLHILDGTTMQPIARAEVELLKPRNTAQSFGFSTMHLGYSDSQGLAPLQIIPRSENPLKVSAVGYVPAILPLRDFADGSSTKEVLLFRGISRTFLFQDSAGKMVFGGNGEGRGIRLGILMGAGFFLMTDGTLWVLPRPGAWQDGTLRFELAPITGGTLHLRRGFDGPSVDLPFSAGSTAVTVTLSEEQLQVLGLR